MRKILFPSFFFILLLSLTLSYAQVEDPRFYHERGTNLTIYEKCRTNGAICPNSYSCFITTISVDRTSLIINNGTMIDGGVYWNFTLNSSQTDTNGLYETTVDCHNSSLAGSNTFYFQITPNGSAPMDFGQGLIFLTSIFFLIVFSTFIGYLGVRSTNTTIMLSFMAFSTILMVFTLGFILNVIELSFGTFSDIISNYSSIYVLFIVLLGIGMVGLIIYLIVITLDYYWKLRGLKDTFSIKT